jgi:hypothetical protein
VVLIKPAEVIWPQTSWSKVMGFFWSAFTRESGIANEAILGDISLKMQNHDAERASAAHQ